MEMSVGPFIYPPIQVACMHSKTGVVVSYISHYASITRG